MFVRLRLVDEVHVLVEVPGVVERLAALVADGVPDLLVHLVDVLHQVGKLALAVGTLALCGERQEKKRWRMRNLSATAWPGC